MKNIREFNGITPNIHNSCYIDESAVVIGKVTIGANTSVWCNVVIRGDVSHNNIGNNTNIQDLTMLHVTHGSKYAPETPLVIGNNVTIGHNSCLHACIIHDNVLIGMGSTILDNVTIQKNVILGAGSLVPPNKTIESNYLYLGNPVKQIRQLTPDEIEFLMYSATHYVNLKSMYNV